LVGQDAAAQVLRAAASNPVHAYLLVGPPGAGKMAAAYWFAALVLCPGRGDDDCEVCGRVARGTHPDLVVFEREGPAITIAQAREVSRVAALGPVEAERKVIVVPDLHLAREAAPALLKTIEEPPPSTIFILLAELVPPELATVASRCVRVDLRPLREEEITAALEADGVPADRAGVLARLSLGRLDRARLLASDPEALARREAWASVPARLDATGYTIAQVAKELLKSVESSSTPLLARQEAELAEAASQEASSVRVNGKATRSRLKDRSILKELEDRHRREQRRQRTDELRTGLAVLAGAYRDRAIAGAIPAHCAAQAVELIDGLSADLAYNPGELLALQALLVRLGRLT
jgi:DNA polymerase-3 subunit delta'